MTRENTDADAFDEWLYGQEGYGLRAERLSEELRDPLDKVLPWLRAAFDVGLSAAPLHEGEATRWLVERHGTNGVICWSAYEHELQARTVAKEEAPSWAGITVTPLYAAPPPSVEVFGSSSLKGEDTHRDADGTVLAYAQAVATYAAKRVGCIPEWRPLDDVYGCLTQIDNCLTGLVAKSDAVSTAEQVGTSVASEPKPSVEVERLREALRDIDACSQHSFGFSDYSMRRRCGQIARAALSRKQEPGVPTPGGEGE